MAEILHTLFYIIFYLLSVILSLFLLFYLVRTFHDEFRKNRILTLYYKRGACGLTRGIAKSGTIYLSYNLRFEEQINYLSRQGYNSISITDLLNCLNHKQKLPPKPIIIALDNGYRSNYLHTYPIIKQYGFTANMFITPNPKAEIFTKLAGIDLPLTDRQIEEMHMENIIIGSHGMTSCSLSKLSDQELEWEFKESKRLLEKITGQKIEYLAMADYEFLDKKTRDMAQNSGYRVILGNRKGTNKLHGDLLNLRKMVIDRDMDLYDFKRFLSPFNIYQARIINDIKNIPALLTDKLKTFIKNREREKALLKPRS